MSKFTVIVIALIVLSLAIYIYFRDSYQSSMQVTSILKNKVTINEENLIDKNKTISSSGTPKNKIMPKKDVRKNQNTNTQHLPEQYQNEDIFKKYLPEIPMEANNNTNTQHLPEQYQNEDIFKKYLPEIPMEANENTNTQHLPEQYQNEDIFKKYLPEIPMEHSPNVYIISNTVNQDAFVHMTKDELSKIK